MKDIIPTFNITGIAHRSASHGDPVLRILPLAILTIFIVNCVSVNLHKELPSALPFLWNRFIYTFLSSLLVFFSPTERSTNFLALDGIICSAFLFFALQLTGRYDTTTQTPV
ncbi:hypothetical protein BLNAU_10138 [Blattamonas nauphoetae]|uniref:Uncharacterized protein n=1 Tax=Blattamonas nauphoetae TaxID=2049346 RepID=A0ABQ9XU45_9EUKA|nr:hypothetical protein BLNAU_10138 [Blattamonas nauphoetae]